MKRSTLENAAFCVVLGVGLCADGLGTTPGGWGIMAGGVAAAALLYYAGQYVDCQPERERVRSCRKRRKVREGSGCTRSIKALAGQKESRRGGRNTAAADEIKQDSKYFV